MQQLGIDSTKLQSNPKYLAAWVIMLYGQPVDYIKMDAKMTRGQVRQQLIYEFGYDLQITLQKPN